MTNQIVIQDEMSFEGMRTLHVMANEVLSPEAFEIPPGAEVKVWVDEVRMQHCMATWPAREAMHGDFGCYGETKPRRMAIWRLDEGQLISEGATKAAQLFLAAFGYWPTAAWVRGWPAGLKVEKAIISICADHWMDLFAVEWAYEHCVLVGGGFDLKEVVYE